MLKAKAILSSRTRGQGRVLEESASDGVVVKTSPSLTRVNLSYNGLSDDGAVALGRCARLNKTIRDLDVSNNRISATGAKVFAAGLKKNDCLEILRVGRPTA